MKEKKKHIWKKESLRLYLVVLFFLLSGIWYSHAVRGGGLEMGEVVTLADLEQSAEQDVGQSVRAEDILGKININLADQEELMRLSGIGEKRAAQIIAYREEKGMFQRIEDIMQISGIGEKTFEEIKDDITVG